jgi:hypothetical protein
MSGEYDLQTLERARTAIIFLMLNNEKNEFFQRLSYSDVELRLHTYLHQGIDLFDIIDDASKKAQERVDKGEIKLESKSNPSPTIKEPDPVKLSKNWLYFIAGIIVLEIIIILFKKLGT